MRKNNYISKEELFFEEAVSGGSYGKKNPDYLELPLSKKAFVLIAVFIVAAGVISIARVAYLGGIKNGFYSIRSEANVGKELYVPSNRGIIFDRYGKPLVENVSSFSVFIKVKDFAKEGEKGERAVADILEMSVEDIQSQIRLHDPEKSTSFILARGADPEKIIKLKALGMNGVDIVDDYTRLYIDGPAFAHVLGYTGAQKANEVAGKTGIEAYYNDILKGKDGKTILYRDARGNILDKKNVELPENGKDITLTIDSDLQKYFYEKLSQALANLGRNSGVGIAVNPRNGEVLSMVSLPSFDNNIFSKSGNSRDKVGILNAPYQPLFNRAVSGTYTPASTVKPMVALAALNEGVITPSKQILSNGYIEIPNPYDPSKPSRFLDWKVNGWVDLRSALARSCNIYFYAVGGGFEDVSGLGIGKLKEYWEKFGFGKKTGIDLFGEAEGSLPDPEQKEALKNDIWRIGDTYNVSIGQGDLLVTPTQLISQIAAIANGGKFYKPRLLKDSQPEIITDFSDLENHIKEVKAGMADTVSKPYGTANILSSIPISIGAKTGSSQVSNNTKTNAFFVGYMPAENPEIAILVLIENAKEGSLNAVPVAKDVLDWYYWNRLAAK